MVGKDCLLGCVLRSVLLGCYLCTLSGYLKDAGIKPTLINQFPFESPAKGNNCCYFYRVGFDWFSLVEGCMLVCVIFFAVGSIWVVPGRCTILYCVQPCHLVVDGLCPFACLGFEFDS